MSARQSTIASAFARWLKATSLIWPNDREARTLRAAYRAGYREAQRRHLDAKIEELRRSRQR